MKLLKNIGILGIALLLQSCLGSHHTLNTPNKDTWKFSHGLLWEISGNYLTSPSYLFGTIHLIPEREFEIPDTLSKIIFNVEQITFEINMDEMADENSMLSVLMKSVMEDGVTLKDLLSEVDYDKIETKFDEIGLPLYMVERIKPMILSVMLSTDMSASNDAMVSYEVKILEMTKKLHKKVNGLESLDFQMSMFDSIPYEVQAKMMMSTLNGDNNASEFNEMVLLYKDQNIEEMSQMVISTAEFKPYEDLLIKNRNVVWIPKMKSQMINRKTLFAVGAGHLGGKNGIISLLQADGYKVRPILFDFKRAGDNGAN